MGDLSSVPGLGKIPWRGDQLPTPVFWCGEFHGQRSLEGHSPVQFSSIAELCLALCDSMDCNTSGLLVQLLEFTQTHVHWVSDTIQPSHPLSSPSPCTFNLSQPSIFPIRVFSNESFLRIRWSNYWSFSFSISPSNEYSGLISFRMDWLDLLAVQGTLKRRLQHHSSEASILWHSTFF